MNFARRLPTLLVAAVAVVLAAAPAERPAPAVALGEPRRFVVHFEDVVRNEGDAPLRDVVCEMALPIDEPRQRALRLLVSPHAWEFRSAPQGGRIATARVAAISPGAAETFSWIAVVDLAAEAHAPRHAPPRRLPSEVAGCLGDGVRIGLASGPVRDAAARARHRAQGDSPFALATAARDVVRDRVRFHMDGGWDPAPSVLERGSGSCTESVFAFLAVSRSIGVPARWAGGTSLRAGPGGRTCDDTFHRIAEAWIPEHGWWPVETQAGREPAPDGVDATARAPSRRRADVPRAFLVLARGDGSASDPLGAAYHARERWERPAVPERGSAAARPRVSKRAWWLDGAPDSAFGRLEFDACEARGFVEVAAAPGGAARSPVDGASSPGGARDFGIRDVITPGPGAAARPVEDARLAAAARLGAAAHPEGLRLAAESLVGDIPALQRHAAQWCDDVLAEEFVAAASGTRAEFEAWWAAAGPRIAPVAPGRVGLVARD